MKLHVISTSMLYQWARIFYDEIYDDILHQHVPDWALVKIIHLYHCSDGLVHPQHLDIFVFIMTNSYSIDE